MEINYSLGDLNKVAKEILSFSKADVFLFYGEMGSGKTTLIKEMGKILEVEDNISSPSFGIVNEYHSPSGPVYHFDCYRLENPEEALDFGIEEYLYSGNKVFIEWPDKISDYLPEDYVRIEIKKMGDGSRFLRLTDAVKN